MFPPNQAEAYNAYAAAISGYLAAAAPSKAVLAAQRRAVIGWLTGKDPAGQKIAAISVPTLIADGTADWVDPVARVRTLARLPDARGVLYPDAAHAFIFQDATQFAAAVESFPRPDAYLVLIETRRNKITGRRCGQLCRHICFSALRQRAGQPRASKTAIGSR
jgi:dienelactone hydrolase